MEKRRPILREKIAYFLWGERKETLSYSFLVLTPDGSKITTEETVQNYPSGLHGWIHLGKIHVRF